MALQRNHNLQNLNTLAIPSIADYFWSVGDEAELIEALRWSKKENVSLNVIGGGSNVILAPRIKGLLLQINFYGKEVIKNDGKHVWLKIGAGEDWHELVRWCLQNKYYGLENLALIPGNAGTAPVQNIGAYGVELKDYFESLRGYSLKSVTWQNLSLSDCQFFYRDSIFKNELKNNFLITEIILKLPLVSDPRFDYPDLKQALDGLEEVGAQDVFNAVIKVRQLKLPDPKQLPNAGSFFKNPIVDQSLLEKIKVHYPELRYFPADNGKVKLAAAWLIDRAGFKGLIVERLKVHEAQALVLTNPESCDAQQVLSAAKVIQGKIKQMFEVDLEIEPQLLGF